MITIRMPADLRTKWLEALRSGEYKQSRGRLQNPRGFCCLGVLQHVADGEVEFCTKDSAAYDGDQAVNGKTAHSMPTFGWLARHNVTFFAENGYANNSPFLPTLNCSADEANDGNNECGQYTFPEIADAIEACSEGV